MKHIRRYHSLKIFHGIGCAVNALIKLCRSNCSVLLLCDRLLQLWASPVVSLTSTFGIIRDKKQPAIAHVAFADSLVPGRNMLLPKSVLFNSDKTAEECDATKFNYVTEAGLIKKIIRNNITRTANSAWIKT